MQLGLIGLGTMGANLARNAAKNGAEVVVYNRTESKTDTFMAQYGHEGRFIAADSLSSLASAMKPHRAILMMVQAGQAVDAVIHDLVPHLSSGDILMDGGNSHFTDSLRREEFLQSKGIRFIGMGVSGGEEGALHGPSMMVGGDLSAYNVLKPLLSSMAASDGTATGKCVEYFGSGGAGHFVKMVHNGIEYGDMQLIAEAYHLLRSLCHLDNAQLATQFSAWNEEKHLSSYLIGITAQIFRTKDTLTGNDLIDLILDKAGQKGTGKWTTQAALDLGAMIPTITAAVDARILSAHKEERTQAAHLLPSLSLSTPLLSPSSVRDALILSKICSYAQGLSMISLASRSHNWEIDLSRVCRVWQGGCIIRSRLLQTFRKALHGDSSLSNLLLASPILSLFQRKQRTWRRVVSKGILGGLPLPAMTSSLCYFDGYFHAWLPQNLTQAQRDFFGAHSFERTDRSGSFHAVWQV